MKKAKIALGVIAAVAIASGAFALQAKKGGVLDIANACGANFVCTTATELNPALIVPQAEANTTYVNATTAGLECSQDTDCQQSTIYVLTGE